ncbi:chitinase-like protein [Perilla frutescens var. hirtella]|uniref:Chitinase-like protein n=1 Tax=Perilla frutescens var. hirtella TaxID=608512 RepID=A0AAD4JQA2_PERFH|nr:chitinase-like protein [Perilla frutescens var. frutescens]KAH6784277.1 chitinase-like protein [Perilla frutescens var. hirtella]KAH6838096.1 chitinase-like protein [Perilla frutescens var. hirtella]
MKPPGGALTAAASRILLPKTFKLSIPDGGLSVAGVFSFTVTLKPPRQRRLCLRVSCTSKNSDARTAQSQYSSQFGDLASEPQPGIESFNFEVRSPSSPPSLIPGPKLSLSDQAFLLLAFIGCTTSIAFSCLVAAAVPTLFAMRRAAISLSKLADTARDELPSTMAAIRLSGMEISDLTLELSDLSQEIADGVNKSAQAVQAAEAGVRQIGSLARQQTMAMIQERASLPIISLQPVVAGAAKKTSRAVGQAAKTFLNIISPGEHNSGDEYDGSTDRTEN